jgi:NADPH-dependent 2,4-dienoyl-CoA reductase/sulfur reductase-like enzyme
MERVVIVGGSVAGVTAVETLREDGFAGELVLINGENHAGYDRPPLSKHVLSGRMQCSDVALRPLDFNLQHRVDHRLGVRATGLDLDRRIVLLDGGEHVRFDALLIATGVRARPLAGQPAWRGIHTLRTLDDALKLRTDLLNASRVVVVGAGFLGSEVAATARKLGLHVTLIDAFAVPMLRQLGREVGTAVLKTHGEHGVEMRACRMVRDFEERDGRVVGVTLDDGEHLAADVVVVAIGALPNTEWLVGSGIDADDGVVCDEYCRAANGVYAAGDVARWFHPGLGASLRIEHRMHATEQGMAAAKNLLGKQVPFAPLPYFWTDFYDVKIQVFGRIAANDAMKVLAGEIGASSFAAAYHRGGVITAVIGWNASRKLRSLAPLVGERVDALAPATISAA